jgi:hypothetical protein
MPAQDVNVSVLSLADAILVLHAVVVLFNFGALPVIWVGYFRDWEFVRNLYFRIIHLVLIGIVAGESILGIICPLTSWEDALRSSRGTEIIQENGFIARWAHQLLFYDFPDWVFTAAYLLFFVLVVFTFCWVRPRFPQRRKNLPWHKGV